MGVKSFFNYSMSSTPQTRADVLLAMLRGERDAYNEEAAIGFIKRGIANKQAADMLTWAALRGRTPIVCILVDKGIINVNARDEFGDTALINACFANELTTITELHKRGADPLQTREGFKCAFYFAENGGKKETYELMKKLYPEQAKAYEKRKEQDSAKFQAQTRSQPHLHVVSNQQGASAP